MISIPKGLQPIDDSQDSRNCLEADEGNGLWIEGCFNPYGIDSAYRPLTGGGAALTTGYSLESLRDRTGHRPPSLHSLPPTPYSLLPTPYSLLPTPYSLLPTPYSLLPTPAVTDYWQS